MATTEAQPLEAAECRCDCGQLLAKWTADGVEIKCKRCRRVVLVTRDGVQAR